MLIFIRNNIGEKGWIKDDKKKFIYQITNKELFI